MSYKYTLRALRAPAYVLCPQPSATLLCGSRTARRTLAPASQLRHHLSRPSSSVSVTEQDPTINPPASTRPPPLDVPTRDPSKSAVGHWIQIGKAYVKFYKTGLSAVFTNRRLLREVLEQRIPSSSSDSKLSVFRPREVPPTFTRADWVLLWRVRHDLARVPLFGLVLLVCGEFTPLVVALVDGVVPDTCRLPGQLQSGFRKAEERRAASLRDLESRFPEGVAKAAGAQGAVQSHVLRGLHLVSTFWDRVNIVPPGLWAVKGNLRMAFLEVDDRLLVKAGGVSGMQPDEVRIACAERGIDIVGQGLEELRVALGDWLRLTAAEDGGEARKRITVLLSTKRSNWPKSRDFALPEWSL